MSTGSIRPYSLAAGPLGWARRHLFRTALDGIITLLLSALVVYAIRAVAAWVPTRRWGVLSENLRVLLTGINFPQDQLWRLWLAVAVVVLAALASAALAGRHRGRRLLWTWVLALVMVLALLATVPVGYYGGLLLNFSLGVTGIAVSFPVGVIIGMGRVSRLPLIRWLSTVYIEMIRGVPIIAVMFFFYTFFNLIFQGLHINQRVALAIVVFTSAYIGEIMRGGILSVPKGQWEASKAVGLSGFQMMVAVVLPQAFRNMIPALVGQFISLFKDTTLVQIIGVPDLLSTGRSITARVIGTDFEIYVFGALVFFVICSTLSYGSRRLERLLGVGERY